MQITHKRAIEFQLTITKYVATRRKPEGRKARHVRVPSKKAVPMPGRERPDRRIGYPTMKITRLLSRADCHVIGEAWNDDCIAL